VGTLRRPPDLWVTASPPLRDLWVTASPPLCEGVEISEVGWAHECAQLRGRPGLNHPTDSAENVT